MTELKLYQIPVVMRAALANLEIDEETGEILNADQLNGLELSSREKIVNTARYLVEMQAFLESMKQVKKNLDARIKTQTRQIEYLKKLALDGMDAIGVSKIEEPDIRISTRKTSSAAIDDEKALPAAYVQIVQETRIDKARLLQALRSGAEVSGAHLETKLNLTIK